MEHTAQLHFVEKYQDKDGSPIYEGWMSGEKAASIFGELYSTRCAMSVQQAIAYKNAVEKKAWQWSQAFTACADGSEFPTKIHADGTPSFDTVKVEVLVERIS